jgi:hypothetical protein
MSGEELHQGRVGAGLHGRCHVHPLHDRLPLLLDARRCLVRLHTFQHQLELLGAWWMQQHTCISRSAARTKQRSSFDDRSMLYVAHNMPGMGAGAGGCHGDTRFCSC